MADEFVLSQLSPREKIEYEHKVGDTTWVATTKRILKFRRSGWTKSLRDLDYKHIVSINIEEKSHGGLLLLAIILVFLGFVIDIPSITPLMVVSGFILGLVWLFSRESYYQFNAPTIKLEDWTLSDTSSQRGKEFIQVVRAHCFYGDEFAKELKEGFDSKEFKVDIKRSKDDEEANFVDRDEKTSSYKKRKTEKHKTRVRTKFCASCGNKLTSKSKFCSKCGDEVEVL